MAGGERRPTGSDHHPGGFTPRRRKLRFTLNRHRRSPIPAGRPWPLTVHPTSLRTLDPHERSALFGVAFPGLRARAERMGLSQDSAKDAVSRAGP